MIDMNKVRAYERDELNSEETVELFRDIIDEMGSLSRLLVILLTK